MTDAKYKLTTRSDDPNWDRVVFAEVLIPETPNVYGDYWTPEAIREAAYLFMRNGFGIDINHDNVDVTAAPESEVFADPAQGPGVYMVESFIARPGDPDFIEGAWVVGMKVDDDVLWQQVLDGELNGYSYEALQAWIEAVLEIEDDGIRRGVTEPEVEDGHTHNFLVIVGLDNRVIEGGTDETNGHSHVITGTPITEIAEGHTHRYNLVSGKGK